MLRPSDRAFFVSTIGKTQHTCQNSQIDKGHKMNAARHAIAKCMDYPQTLVLVIQKYPLFYRDSERI